MTDPEPMKEQAGEDMAHAHVGEGAAEARLGEGAAQARVGEGAAQAPAGEGGEDAVEPGVGQDMARARVGEDEAQGQTSVTSAAYKRLMSGFAGYVFAMAVCFAIVGLIIVITPRRTPTGIPPQIDYSIDLANARAAAHYTVYAPEGLPPAWVPTSSHLTGTTRGPVTWHLGFVTPAGEYAGLEQSDERATGSGGFIFRMTNHGISQGSMQVAGVSWDKSFRKEKNQRSLVRPLNGLTLIVTGTASYDELATLAASLRPLPRTAGSSRSPSHS